MSTDQRNLPAYLDTNATFQTWVQGIHAQLAACGLIQTSDTGQINPATAILPSAGSVAGYEIWRLNDAAQATQPVFLKIEYGAQTLSQNRPMLWMTAGPTTNGAGTITGTTTGRLSTAAGASQSGVGVTLPSYCSGDGSWIGLFTNSDVATGGNNMTFILDRIRDTTGAPTGEGFILCFSNSSGPGAVSVINGIFYGPAGATFGAEGVFPGPSPINGGPAIGGGARTIGQSLGVMPLIVMAGQLRYSKAGVVYCITDLGAGPGITFTATNFGANHTYMTMAKPGQTWANNVSDNLALLWE